MSPFAWDSPVTKTGCCSGKIPTNLSFILKFPDLDHKLHIRPTHGRRLTLKEGASSQADQSTKALGSPLTQKQEAHRLRR